MSNAPTNQTAEPICTVKNTDDAILFEMVHCEVASVQNLESGSENPMLVPHVLVPF